MANQFQEVTVTTKSHHNCNECYKRLTTGTKALVHFYMLSGTTQTIWICDIDCLVTYRVKESKGDLDSFLDSFASFN